MSEETLADVISEFLHECRAGDHPTVSEDSFWRMKGALHRADRASRKPAAGPTGISPRGSIASAPTTRA